MRLFLRVAFLYAPLIVLMLAPVELTFAQDNTIKGGLFSVRMTNDTEQAILTALAKPYAADYFEQRMGDVVSEWSGKSRVTVLLHETAADNNLDPETLITEKLSESTVAAIIEKTTAKFECTLSITHDVILIVSNDFAKANPDLRVYDCAKLIANKMEGDVKRLLKTIQEKVDPYSWPTAGGTGTMGEFDGSLIIGQTFANHVKIGQLLAELAN